MFLKKEERALIEIVYTDNASFYHLTYKWQELNIEYVERNEKFDQKAHTNYEK